VIGYRILGMTWTAYQDFADIDKVKTIFHLWSICRPLCVRICS